MALRPLHVVRTRRRGYTLAVDTDRAARFETLARDKLRELLASVPEHERPGLSRAVVQEAVRVDMDERGDHEARAWAAKQGRAA